jgi:hypothetical protein
MSGMARVKLHSFKNFLPNAMGYFPHLVPGHPPKGTDGKSWTLPG